ncbi:Gfo/Idh/MocA family protein [Vibrio olivae]
MKRSSLNAVIIGTGMIANVHFRSLQAAGVNVLGLVDANPTRAAEIAEQWGVQVFDDLDQALASEQVDVVHVCTPNIFHFEMAKKSA